jgi:bis(5'-adenosyl)-triphosphatase
MRSTTMLYAGHVLVSPKRVAPRFSDLDSKEVADLWALAQRVGSRIESHYQAKALTFTIQVLAPQVAAYLAVA